MVTPERHLRSAMMSSSKRLRHGLTRAPHPQLNSLERSPAQFGHQETTTIFGMTWSQGSPQRIKSLPSPGDSTVERTSTSWIEYIRRAASPRICDRLDHRSVGLVHQICCL